MPGEITMDNIQKIERNLYSLYHNVARAAGLEYRREDHYSWVRNPIGSWPNYVFDINLEMMTSRDFMDQLAGRMKNKEVPSIIVSRLPENAGLYFEIAEKNGLREINGWTGMALQKSGFHSRGSHPAGINVEQAAEREQRCDWMEIVNSALFNSKSLSPEMTNVLDRIDGMELYTGFVSGVPVCTALSFRQDEVAGLYMISTLSEYRGKGYGTQVTLSAIENCFASGANTIVLHASGMGENIYRSLGFKDYCKFGILWMVGREFT
jgi:GNAT superfamily N-acetyltransferase